MPYLKNKIRPFEKVQSCFNLNRCSRKSRIHFVLNILLLWTVKEPPPHLAPNIYGFIHSWSCIKESH